VRKKTGKRRRKERTRGASANSLPTLLGLLAILKISLAREYLKILKLRVGPLGSRINLKLTVVVPSMSDLSCSSLICFAVFCPGVFGSEVEGIEIEEVEG
jgi:hypothetical protein